MANRQTKQPPQHQTRHTPMGRPGQPEEVAPAYVFPACTDASYMWGQVLHPNGGEVANA